MMCFPFDKLFGVLECGSNIFGAQVVFAADLFKSHTTRQPSQNSSYRYSGASNHGFAVLDLSVNDNTVIH